jgi:signal transduction histidine kinase/ActR/RegA family two-component response regulator
MDREDLFERVLILAPTRKDGEVTSSLLVKAGLNCLVSSHLQHLAQEVCLGAGAVLLTEEVIGDEGIQHLLEALNAQPTWSNLPIVMLMKGAVPSPDATRVLRGLRNVTLLERPAPTRSVVSAVQTALRGREWQYKIRDQLDEIQAGQNERQHLLESERAARQESERASHIKDEFLATLSHELRTPLNAILGWAQIIKMSPRNEEAVLEGITVIDRNVRVQTELIEDLLDMSRIVSGKVRLDLRSVALAEVIDAALESVRPAISAKGIRLEKLVDPVIGSVNGDHGRLQQVFWNLLTNAVKFTPKGGTIQVRAERVQSHLEVRVSDTGAGIAPEFLPQLFERFSQADASTTRAHGGLGLGLSIVRHLVEMHGGTVSASSAGIGKGAAFVIHLPLRAMRAGEAASTPDTEAHAKSEPFCDPEMLKGLKVLVVDDEADARDLVRRFLLECGAIPALAASATEANSLLPTFKPDVIISDIGMPTQDGYAFMRAIRVQGLKTPALALTAFARPEDRVRSLQAGFQMHLPKPVDPAELITVIANLAGRFELLDEAPS